MELSSSFFLPGVDVSQVYVGAWVLGCFHIHISTQTFRRVLTGSVNSCVSDKERPFNGVTNCGGVWRKALESGARSVGMTFPFLSNRNPLWIPSNQTSRHFFSQNNRPAMFFHFVLLSFSASSHCCLFKLCGN